MLKVSVQEGDRTGCSISLQDRDGGDTIAILSTEELWSTPRSDKAQTTLSMLRPTRALYATVQKFGGNNGLVVMRGQTPLLSLAGDFGKAEVKAFAADGTLIASTTPVSSEDYHLYVQAKVDAGVVILALLAADKLGMGSTKTSI